MTTLARNQDISNNDQMDTVAQALEFSGLTASAALHYPSLKGNCWDDELLPSGD